MPYSHILPGRPSACTTLRPAAAAPLCGLGPDGALPPPGARAPAPQDISEEEATAVRRGARATARARDRLCAAATARARDRVGALREDGGGWDGGRRG